jgi:Zn finger protein HypA/HybF involved in hydrogenase expression
MEAEGAEDALQAAWGGLLPAYSGNQDGKCWRSEDNLAAGIEDRASERGIRVELAPESFVAHLSILVESTIEPPYLGSFATVEEADAAIQAWLKENNLAEDDVDIEVRPAEVSCQNCEWEGMDSETKEIEDISMRVSAGELVPAGECPLCGALCHNLD